MADTTTTAKSHLPIPPMGFVIIGIIALFFWAWGNIVQIQTSEAFILGLGNGGSVSLVPNFHVLEQPANFFAGQYSPDMMMAVTWAWGLEALLLIVSVGIDYAVIVHKHHGWFDTGALVLLAINSIADLTYGSIHTGFWGHVGFAVMTLFMSFFFGLAGVHLIFKGLAGMKA